ncbi:hypothetical protein, partial [Pseudomonas sp. SIMBA_068]
MAHKKASLANQVINEALVQDPKNNKFQLMYYRSLALSLMLSTDEATDSTIEKIINFLKSQNFKNTSTINTQITL